MKKLTNNIKRLRKLHKLTQLELGDKLDVKHNTVSGYETGETIPSIDKLIIMADIFDVSLDELVGREYKEKNQLKEEIDKELVEIKNRLYEKYGL